jgi:hypothetical protein
MMDRRQFVNFIAMMAAGGAAAKPEQVEAFQHYYEVNTPLVTDESLVAVDEIMVSGMAARSTPLRFRFWAERHYMPIAFNLFGGIVRWTALPDGRFMASAADVRWTVECPSCLPLDDDWVNDVIVGHIGYIDSIGARHYRPIDCVTGNLASPWKKMA